MQQIRPRQLADWLSDDSRRKPVLLDVREPGEFALCSLPGSQHIPMHLIPHRLAELNPDDEIVVICHHGGRSMQVAMFLERQGYSTLHNLMGGVDAWATEVDPKLPRY
jgi:rhodanese-related sulfurtransferase